MKRMTLVLLLCLSVPLAAPASAQRNWDEVVIRPERLADGLWMLSGAGGNMALCVGPQGALLVDAEYGRLADRIRATVDSLAGGVPLRVVLNTHYHGDHVNGDSAMAANGAIVVAHDEVRRRMGVERHDAAFGSTTPAYAEVFRPTITFRDSITLHVGAQECRVVHVPPAHTDGDAFVRFLPADVLHTGDLFFNGMYPVIDVSAGGSIGGMIREADRLLGMVGPGTRIVPGHGPLADRAALERFRAMLATTRERVARLVREGRTLEQIVAARPLADLDPAWAKGSMTSERFLKMVHQDLSRGTAE